MRGRWGIVMKEVPVVIVLLLLISTAPCRADASFSSATEWISDKAQKVAGSVRNFVGDKLGPTDNDHCTSTAEGCEETQGFSRTKSDAESSENGAKEDDKDVMVVEEEDTVQYWNVMSTITNTLTNVRDTLAYTAYKRATDFSESIRSVLREEFYQLMEGFFEYSVGALFTEPDTLMGKFSQAVVNKILGFGLIIICLVFNYIFWQLYFSILFILAFDSAVFLASMLWKPIWVYSKFWYLMQYMWGLLAFVWNHPYISTFVIMVLFVLSIVWPIVKCWARRKRERQQITIEQTVLQLSWRLIDMEKRQKEQNEVLQRMENRQKEILDYLRQNN